MSFLLDTDTCSAYLKNDPAVVGRVMLHYGGLNVSVITVGELLTWALRAHALQLEVRQLAEHLVDRDLRPTGQIVYPPRHSAGNNYVFYDGHVKWMKSFLGSNWRVKE